MNMRPRPPVILFKHLLHRAVRHQSQIPSPIHDSACPGAQKPEELMALAANKERLFSAWRSLHLGWRLCFALVLVSSLALAAGKMVWADDDDRDGDDREPFAIGLWGDMPYNDVQALVGVPNLIADMNSQRLAFTVHDGDLKAGKGIAGSTTPTTCSDDLYQYALDHYFSQLKAPAAFTPGDNDWTDCDAAENGPFNSLERLDHERQFFFKSPFTLGQRKL